MKSLRGCAVFICIACASCSSGSGEQDRQATGGSARDIARPQSPSWGNRPEYRKVDLSFSDIAIDTPFRSIASRLTIIREKGSECEAELECDYRDSEGVRHYFASDGSRALLTKVILANEFADRPISALGIGLARDKPYVMAKVRAFVPEIAFGCGPSRNSGNNECSGGVFDGGVFVEFDRHDRLQSVVLNAYPI